MSYITLQTDFGGRDGFVAAMKGVIARLAPQAVVIDVSHDIPMFDMRTAGLNWCSILPYFPPGTIHVSVIDPGVGTARAILVARFGTQICVAPDNGLLTPLIAHQGPPEELYHGTNPAWRAPHPHPTFHGRDIFAPLAAHLANGEPLSLAGPRVTDLVQLRWPVPVIAVGQVTGEILHVDHFGNCWTNIRPADLTRAALAPETTAIAINEERWQGIQPSYGHAAQGALVAVINSADFVELAIVQGNAAGSLGWSCGTLVRCSSAEH